MIAKGNNPSDVVIREEKGKRRRRGSKGKQKESEEEESEEEESESEEEEEASESESESDESDEETKQLPRGWNKIMKTRARGKTKGKVYPCYVSPSGKQFRSLVKVKEYLENNEEFTFFCDDTFVCVCAFVYL